MPDLPMGQPPRVAGPIQGVAPVVPYTSGEERRRDPGGHAGHAGRPPAGKDEATPTAAAQPPALPPTMPDPLVQALDRLRATNEIRPVDAELARLLRGKREYANTPPGGSSILPE